MQKMDDTDTLAGALIVRIREAVLNGKLPDGERVNEVHLARTLGVSRTPLREALNRLVAERLLTLRPRHGYYVPPLSIEDCEAEYGIRPILDVAALEQAGAPPPGAVDALEKINQRIQSAKAPEQAILLDNEFHLRLIAHTPNPVLIELIELMMIRTQRYEYAYFRETGSLVTASDQHAEIIEALRDSDLERACGALRENLTSGLGPLRGWLATRNSHR